MNRKKPKKIVVLPALVGGVLLALALSLFLAPAAAHIPSNASLFHTVQARPFPIDNAMPSALAPSDCGSSTDGCRSTTALAPSNAAPDQVVEPDNGYPLAQSADVLKSPSSNDSPVAETTDPSYGYRPAQTAYAVLSGPPIVEYEL